MHWADDQVEVALRRVPGEAMSVGALQEVTGLSPEDLESALTGLQQGGLLEEQEGLIHWLGREGVIDSSNDNGAGPDGPDLTGDVAEMAKQAMEGAPVSADSPAQPGPWGTVAGAAPIMDIAKALIDQTAAGEPLRVHAEVYLVTNRAGQLQLVSVERVLAIEVVR